MTRRFRVVHVVIGVLAAAWAQRGEFCHEREVTGRSRPVQPLEDAKEHATKRAPVCAIASCYPVGGGFPPILTRS